MSDLLIRIVVRTLNWFWGPEPPLTAKARAMAHRGRFYDYPEQDYATKARLYYGDDQY